MRQLLPTVDDAVDVYDAYRSPDPAGGWVRLNMVASLDGHITDGTGVSGGLGGDGDHEAFVAMRHLADAVVAGAGTVRAEGYGPMRLGTAWAHRRRADGRDGPAPIVVITRSGNLDTTSPLFTEAIAPTIVLTTTDAPAERVRGIVDAGGRVITAGEGDVDLATGLAALREEHGLSQLLVEGGPTLNGDLLTAGLVDELCLTLSPQLAGGADPRRVVDGLAGGQDLDLTRVMEDDGELLLTYRVRRHRPHRSEQP